jgi:hypothetical protein
LKIDDRPRFRLASAPIRHSANGHRRIVDGGAKAQRRDRADARLSLNEAEENAVVAFVGTSTDEYEGLRAGALGLNI